jgi:hypothetical protein
MERRSKEAQARIDARNAAKGVQVIAKSSVVLDVKPWDDETGAYHSVSPPICLHCIPSPTRYFDDTNSSLLNSNCGSILSLLSE